MTELSVRKLYQQCLFLYPADFRHEFGEEMLDMFEDCRAAQGSFRLLADLVFSAAKQQIRHCSTPLRKSRPPYVEIAWSPKLAKVFALIALSTGLITISSAGNEKPKTGQLWIATHAERRLWWPRSLQQPACSERRRGRY